ncbi:hypothetical protein JGK52_17130 [Cytobacillus oceanisediminis]|uniref:hypothetical protein n=1 Tax=Cytobacillus TaxID=2675230 RepID=UPI00064E20E7|nr:MULTISPECIES: hypothetical protein [Cytobacillus]KML37546.1 hypothetical protein VL14_18690 [Cytobacillus firmus]MCC3648389.1 hypothetical protein [Cytobacillus oceanisediminis]
MNEAKMENMLAQLIKMVGSLQSDMQEMKKEQQEMKQEQQGMKQEQQGMKQELQKLETKSDQRHQEILEHFKVLERDQDFIWEKTARNERDIGNIKRQLT